jgi:HSP20 family protein
MTELMKHFGDPFAVPSNFFSDFFEGVNFKSYNSSYPYNLYQIGDKVVLEYALAGFSKEDIKVKVEGDYLKVNVSKPPLDHSIDEMKFINKGISFRELKGSWRISGNIDVDSIKTSFENGLLKVVMPMKKDHIKELSID